LGFQFQMLWNVTSRGSNAVNAAAVVVVAAVVEVVSAVVVVAAVVFVVGGTVVVVVGAIVVLVACVVVVVAAVSSHPSRGSGPVTPPTRHDPPRSGVTRSNLRTSPWF
jgi:hypothetical protein